MLLTIKLGDTVVADLEGHSSVNGAVIPEGSSVEVTSNDETVAMVDSFVVPAGGATTISAAVTVLAKGSTDFHVTVTTPDGTIFEDTSTLIVEAAPEPGLARVALTLRKTS